MAISSAEVVELRIKIGGPAGFGIKVAGQLLSRVFNASGYYTFDLTEYPSLIKGGHNSYHLRICSEEIYSHVEPVDILVALDRDTVVLHRGELTSGAAIIYDPDDFDLAEVEGVPEDVCRVPVPLKRFVREMGGLPIMRNVVAIAAVLGYTGFPEHRLLNLLRAQFANKDTEVIKQNINCADMGYEHAKNNECAFPFKLPEPADDALRLFMDANEAIGCGAIAAGMGLYCAYPMTPASGLLHFLAKTIEAYKFDGVVKHTEDEIAAINMAIGGGFGGTRSMCATSGGGFSLMVEALGLAGVSETPVVVGLFTRPGPATGMPTWTEQSDLRFAIHAAQGEFPRVILAPGDVEDAFDLTWQAFNLADQLQTPVIILADTYLTDNRQSVEPLSVLQVVVDRGELITQGEVTDYLRYRVTESGVSPRAIPGVRGAEQIVNSYEHDEYGYGAAGEDAQVRIAQNEKRMRKLELARTLVPPPQYFGPEEAELSLLIFGSTKRPVRQALQWLEEEQVAVNVMQVVTVWPFPAEEVSAFLTKAKRTAVIEGNYTGQLQGLVREFCLTDFDHTLRRYDGRPFSPEQVYGFCREVLG